MPPPADDCHYHYHQTVADADSGKHDDSASLSGERGTGYPVAGQCVVEVQVEVTLSHPVLCGTVLFSCDEEGRPPAHHSRTITRGHNLGNRTKSFSRKTPQDDVESWPKGAVFMWATFYRP